MRKKRQRLKPCFGKYDAGNDEAKWNNQKRESNQTSSLIKKKQIEGGLSFR
jgi:hypothetical protein